MKPLSVSALLAAGTVAVLTAIAVAPVEAGSNLNSTKSNAFKPISSQEDEAECLRVGGAVVLQGKRKVCSMPAQGSNLNSTKSNY
jgi:hypothetical protein